MDILSHTLSGIVIGTAVASFSSKGRIDQLKIILFSGFAAALPDLDAISLWSQFDSTIGNFFQLTNSGKDIYIAKFWYSHHAFMHSLFAAFLFPLLFVLSTKIINRKRSFKETIYKNKLLIIALILGFIIHLFEDMPTPASSWGGIRFFWPNEQYIGGFGKIWWWNNYDIFIIIAVSVFMNTIILIFSKQLKSTSQFLTIAILFISVVFSINQMNSRNFDFSSTKKGKHQEFEQKSLEIQKEILGDQIFRKMNEFDKKMKFYF